MSYHRLTSYQHNWTCCQCGTCNAPDYETCQECHADIDGNQPEETECTARRFIAPFMEG